jgi:hypothetical protein
MARRFFTYEIDSSGAVLRLLEKPLIGSAKPVPIDEWAVRLGDEAFSGVSRVLALLEDDASAVEPKDGGIFLDHPTIASLSEPQALGLAFPPAMRVALQVSTKNLITDPDFQIVGRWIGEANRVLNVERTGAFLTVGGMEYRVPEPLFSLSSAIDKFAARRSEEGDRMAELAELQALLPDGAQEQLTVDSYFASLRIFRAAAFSLKLKVEGQAFDFDPVLFGRRVVETVQQFLGYGFNCDGGSDSRL